MVNAAMNLPKMNEGGGRILVVDDDPDIRKVLTILLKAVGYQVDIAEDGDIALEIIERDDIDLVLLDVTMPRLGGFEVMERMNAMDDPPVVIFLTAQGARDDRLQGLFSGAINYITKPFEPAELVAQISSVMKQRMRLEKAQKVSRRDALTGLWNRLAFDQGLATELARSSRYHHAMALAMLDADGLKMVNDTHGHAAGDDLIKAISRAIIATCRGTDRGARIGGDEFAVILPETDREAATRFLERLSVAIEAESFLAGGMTLNPACSMGLALFPDDGRDAEALKQHADAALYQHKRDRRKERTAMQGRS